MLGYYRHTAVAHIWRSISSRWFEIVQDVSVLRPTELEAFWQPWSLSQGNWVMQIEPHESRLLTHHANQALLNCRSNTPGKYTISPSLLPSFFQKTILIPSFFWPHFMTWKILVSQPGNKSVSLSVKVTSPNHWTAREFPPIIVSCWNLRVWLRGWK